MLNGRIGANIIIINIFIQCTSSCSSFSFPLLVALVVVALAVLGHSGLIEPLSSTPEVKREDMTSNAIAKILIKILIAVDIT